MKLKTITLSILVIIGLAYVGAKWFIYHKTKTTLDKIIQTASPLVQIDYTDVGSKLSGTIYIDSIRLTPVGSYDEITIKQLSITGDGFNFLLDLAFGFTANELPSQLNFTFSNLKAPVSVPLFSSLATPVNKTKSKIEIDSCSIPGILNATGLQKIDISSITANGSIEYVYDKASSQTEIKLQYDLSGVESTLLELRVSQLTTQGMIGTGKLPIVEKFRLVRKYLPEYVKRIVDHCATDASLAAAAFIDDLFTQSDDYYIRTLGFVPGPGLSSLFKQLITNAGTVEIKATPSSEISPVLLKAYRAEDLVDLFGVTASYNSTPITDLSFSTYATTVNNKQRANTIPESDDPQVLVASPTKIQKIAPKPTPKLRYLDTELSVLNNYLHHKVRVFTRESSKPKRGILAMISKTKLDVEQLVFGGKISSHIYLDTIERVEVLRKERPEDK